MALFSTVAEAIAKVHEVAPQNGFVFQDMAGEEADYSFGDIEAATANRAAALQSLGLKKGDRIGLIVIEPEDFVLTFLAAVRVGVLPVPLYPPMSFGSLDAYAERTAKVLDTSGTSILVASEKLQNVLWGLVDQVPSLRKLICVETLADHEGTPDYPEISPEDTCFLQYTSGSTSDPKGVIVTHGNLIENCHQIIVNGLKMSPTKGKGVSWLPLYHDMGLIGFVLAPICNGIPVVFIPTMRFIKRPSVWLDTIHRHRGTATFAPNFAYALATRRIRESDLDRWDLSCLEACGCGAEPIQPETIRTFTKLFHERCNMPTNAVLPAYGMAEATLAISFKPLDQDFRTNVVDADAYENGGKAIAPIDGQPYLEHVSCGPAFPGHEVVSMNEHGEVNPEGVEGELCLKGPSNTRGYYRNPEATAATHKNGWLHTGDLGYVMDGEVYITGRLKDLIILNGRNLHPQSIEWIAAEVDGVRKGNVVAFSRPGANSEELVLVCETRKKDLEELEATVRKSVQKEMSLAINEVVFVKPGTLPKTSSGKLQRRKTRQMYLAGGLGDAGPRTMGSTGSRITLAKHVARSIWSRAKATALLR